MRIIQYQRIISCLTKNIDIRNGLHQPISHFEKMTTN